MMKILFEELKNLVEILHDYRGETQKIEKQAEWARMSFKGDTVFKQVKLNILNLAEMLKKVCIVDFSTNTRCSNTKRIRLGYIRSEKNKCVSIRIWNQLLSTQ